eukprot:9620707-Alexandrium_andersonii.AAC.1
MSASLVGSEMCIRDRWFTGAPFTPARGLRLNSGSRFAGTRPSRRRRGTVSYTHLTLPTICSV